MTRPAEDHELEYMSVQLQLLEQCNLRCTHCYNANPPPVRVPSTAEIKRRLDLIYAFARDHGFDPDIHLSGGEPTLRRDLVQIVKHIFDAHDGDALLFTNGTRFPRALARDLRNAGLGYVQVSLEGPERLTDEVRGAGVYTAAMDTVRMLGDEGFRRTVSITITSRNFDGLFAFVEELDALDLHFHLREVFPIGAGAALAPLTRDQRRELYEWAVGWLGRSTVGLEDPAHCSVSRDYAGGRRGCVAARNHFCVDVDGSVYPCRPLALRVGHIDDLAEAWSSATMTRIRRREFGGRCGRCEIRGNCGGCRVYAQLAGDVFGEDTRCFAPAEGLVRTPFEEHAIRASERVGRGIWWTREATRAAVKRVRRLRAAR